MALHPLCALILRSNPAIFPGQAEAMESVRWIPLAAFSAANLLRQLCRSAMKRARSRRALAESPRGSIECRASAVNSARCAADACMPMIAG